ncbi:MAG: hypothetical protein LBV52_00465 [Spirochaetaceae bacterium]|jgi:predicted LPLAT superfamily acyltransferase|nr:hypothetical protein [Spirochaetaceae bacterium]
MKDSASLHWSKQKEEASGWQLKLLLFMVRVLPLVFVKLCAYIVSFFYFIFCRRFRRESKRFFDNVALFTGNKKLRKNSFKHCLSFSLAIIEKMEAWSGKIYLDRVHFKNDDINILVAGLEKKQGALLICSHLGNAELLRALADFNRTGVSRNVPVISIVDIAVSPHFMRMIKELNPKANINIISSNDISAGTAIMLEQHIKDGGLVVIAGDRTSANTSKNNMTLPFLGKDAVFANGPFFLALLLKTDVYFIFALRQKDITLFPQYDMFVKKSSVQLACSRKERDSRIKELACEFALCLEAHCTEHPLQWYNFYNFWSI